MLAWTIYISFAGALVLALLPKGNAALARAIALIVAAAGFAIAIAGFAAGAGQGRITLVDVPWVPSMGIHYVLAADGISRVLVLLTGLAAVTGVLFSWNIELRTNEFFAFFLALIGGVYGVFLSFDLFLLFVFYEIAIVPKYFLIAIWGSTRREYAAMKLVLYSFVGSSMVLIGLLAAYATAGSHSTGLVDLANANLPVSFQMWAFPLVFVGFGILAGLWPFHTWAPTGHVAAPTAASMLLAGVVMKLGAYGCLRVAIGLFPHGLDPWGWSFWGIGSWRDVFAILAVIGIVYGALVALAQTDFKFVIGYSSVSHMGFVLLGLVTLKQIGVTGAVLQMFSHGVIADCSSPSLAASSTSERTLASSPNSKPCISARGCRSRPGPSLSPEWLRWDCPASPDSSPNCRSWLAHGSRSPGGRLPPASALLSELPTPGAPFRRHFSPIACQLQANIRRKAGRSLTPSPGPKLRRPRCSSPRL